MIFAGILAGGYGWDQKREDMPKQYMLLGQKAIILHTIEQFIINSKIDYIIIAAPSNWLIYTEELVKKNCFTDKPIVIVEGGKNKYQTIIRIANYISKNFEITDDDICVYHDAIRPFVTQRIINDNLQKAEKCQAVSTVVPTVDTIIRSDNGKIVDEIPAKKNLYAEQTPQTFHINSLLYVNKQLNQEEENQIVNAFRSFLQQGNEVQIVKGEFSNIKIVTQYDLEVANALIRDKKND